MRGASIPRPTGCGRSSDQGAVTVLAAALAGVVVTIASVAVLTSGVLIERHRLSAGADAAAIAAADALAGLTPQSPCEAARSLAEADQALLESCVMDGETVTVRVRGSVGMLAIGASATAGPPPGSSGVRTAPSKK